MLTNDFLKFRIFSALPSSSGLGAGRFLLCNPGEGGAEPLEVRLSCVVGGGGRVGDSGGETGALAEVDEAGADSPLEICLP